MKALLPAICLLVLFTAAARAADAPVDLGAVREEHVMIPMRDGQRLSAWLYHPPGPGPWPAIFEQRYADIRGAGSRRAAAKFAEGGFVIALVNYRGAGLSEGQWRGYRALAWGELQDGFDTCEWLAKQPWCTGKIGTYGGSQAGYAQNFLAITQPPHLVAQYMTDTGLSLYQEGYRIGGVTRPERFKTMGKVARVPEHNDALLQEWFAHPHYDSYWRDEDCSLHFPKMNVPAYTIGSWYDFMCQGSVMSFIGRQHQAGANSRGQQQLIIGPWLHGGYPKSNKIGEMNYPTNAFFDVYAHMTTWFNHHLKGTNNGVMADPTVKYYVMGATGETNAPGNVWRTALDWPPHATPQSFYLREQGRLSTGVPSAEKSSTSYVSDPFHPMSIPGAGFPGAKDARPFEVQPEVRTFTTEPLAEPTEWTGLVKVELWVSSTARDTDFLVRVSDVYPDGRSMLLMDYPRRARYREGFDHEKLLKPGEPALLAFDVGWTSIVFNRGHRIRVTVASTGAPLYEPNPQTGGPQTIEFPKDARVATNTVHHSRVLASRIIAPTPSEDVPAVRAALRAAAGGRAGEVTVELGRVADGALRERVRKELPTMKEALALHAQAVAVDAATREAGGLTEWSRGGPPWLVDLAGEAALLPFRTLVSVNLYNGNNPLKGKGGLNTAINDEWLGRVSGLTTLTNLDVANCDVRGPGLKHIGTLRNLERLNFTLTPLTDPHLKHLGGLTKLRVFSFASAKCTGEGFAHLGALQAVENLNFHYTPVNDAGLREIARLQHLERLEIVHTHFTDAGALHLAKMTSLRRLQLGSQDATGAAVASLVPLRNLRELDLSDKQASTEGARWASLIPSLRVLRISGGAIKDEGVRHLASLPQLETLLIPGTQVTDAGVEALARVKSLRHLDLKGNKVSDEAVARLQAALPGLRVVR
ncbi:MAG: Cocaine esterase [Verrucomicrobiota bacterium]|jgi:predicted acyl esterase